MLRRVIADGYLNKARVYVLTVGENAVELAATLIVLIIVERSLGKDGLGLYSYLLSLFLIAGYLSEFGIPGYLEREMALHFQDTEAQSTIFKNAYTATIRLGVLCAILFIISAVNNTTDGNKAVALIMIGFAILFRNLNSLKLAYLQGMGRHTETANLRFRRRLSFLVVIFILLFLRVPASYLALSFLMSELYLLATMRKTSTPNRSKALLKRSHDIPSVYRKGYEHLFTDDAMDILLYLDFLILGLFVAHWELGIYAQASILARLFLLVPLSIKPILRQRYCSLVANNALSQAASSIRRISLILFSFHAVLALFITLHFPQILQLVFRTRGEELIGYRIFVAVLPGLLFFSAMIAIEPIYEAVGQVQTLKKLIMGVSALNLGLNIYLVPFAGYYGAAAATMISMFTYFLFFGATFPKTFRFKKTTLVSAGAGIYLIHVFLQRLNAGFGIDVFLIPITGFLLFWLIGFFDVRKEPIDSSINNETALKGGFRNGEC